MIECSSTNSSFCKTCTGMDCNNKSVLNKCFVCNSVTDPNCISNPSEVEEKVCPDYNDNQCCTIINDDKTTQRGCCNDDANFRAKCNGENSECSICSTQLNNLCNDKEVLDTCIVCDSKTNPLCTKEPEKIGESACTVRSLRNTRGCYVQRSRGGTKRGCYEDLSYVIQMQCYEKKGLCDRCIGKNCNRKVNAQQTCYACNGTNGTSCTEAKATETVLWYLKQNNNTKLTVKKIL